MRYDARPVRGRSYGVCGREEINVVVVARGVGVDDEFNQKDTNFSLFTHNIISLTDRLKLTLGVRYTHDKKSLDATLRDNNTLCAFFSAATM